MKRINLGEDGNVCEVKVSELQNEDQVIVGPGETVRVIATFEQAGVFMYHCHILEHEDAGMMGQFEVR